MESNEESQNIVEEISKNKELFFNADILKHVKGDQNIEHEYYLIGTEINTARKIAELMLSYINRDLKKFMDNDAFIFYAYESLEILEASKLLAFHGYYNMANSLLRNVLEAISKGAFYTHIYNHLSLNWDAIFIRNNKNIRRLISDIDDVLNSEENKNGQKIRGAISLLLEVEEKLNEGHKSRFLKYEDILRQLYGWGYLEPFGSDRKVREYFKYSELSEYIHEKFITIDNLAIIFAGGEPFERSIVPELLDEYYENQSKVIDYYCLIHLNFFKKNVESNKEFKEQFLKLDEEFESIKGKEFSDIGFLEAIGLEKSNVIFKKLKEKFEEETD